MNRRSFIAMSGATIATGARLREGLSLFAAQAGPTAATNSTIIRTAHKYSLSRAFNSAIRTCS
jgi:hypothetical protein